MSYVTQHLEALKAALDAEVAGMDPRRSFQANAAAFKAASVAFHDFLRSAVEECGGDADYLPEANILAQDIAHAFTAGEEAADKAEPFEAPYGTLDRVTQGLRGAA
ncbi:UNVERIFIED_ORG: hypothetical protein J2W66_002913 [Agrobacterium larrymoorei]|uniref:hypothetical protein n=1 Tax=Agrobacterium cavarae TaxID=2528239 RepID=UPI002785C22E|nr:hypothetical protein [Agrobacterium larrymoorei]